MKLEHLGCHCAQCPLRDAPGPLPPARAQTPEQLLLMSHPRDAEASTLRQMAGAGGRLLGDLLREAGFTSRTMNRAYAVACQPPDNDLGNAERTAKAPMSAIQACRPQWKSVQAPQILATGAPAWEALTGQESVEGVMAAPFYGAADGDRFKLLPPDPMTPGPPAGATVQMVASLDPSRAVFRRALRAAVASAVTRAGKFFRGQMSFPLPKMVLQNPDSEGASLADLARVLLLEDLPGASPEEFYWSDDIETQHSKHTPAKSILQCEVYLFGVTRMPRDTASLTDPRAATVVFAFRDLKGRPCHPLPVLEAARDLLRRVFPDERYTWVGQNAGNFDDTVYLETLGVAPKHRIDTKTLHWAAFPGVRHDLGYIGATMTDAPGWKQDFTTGEKLSDADANRDMAGWIKYNALDTAVTVAAAVPLLARLRQRQGEMTCPEWRLQQAHIREHGALPPGHQPYPFRTLFDLWAFKQRCARAFQRQGLPVDANVVRALLPLLQHEAAFYLARVRAMLGDVNPSSPQQLAKLLFGAPPVGWGLEPLEYTDTGAPSTSDDALKAQLQEGLPPERVRVLRAIILYRRVQNKWLGTYVWPLHPDNPERIPWDSPIATGAQWVGTPYEGFYPPRVRGSWNSEGTPVNRFAVSKPNLQTYPNGEFLVSWVGEVMTPELHGLLTQARVKPPVKVGEVMQEPLEINFRKMFAAPPGFVMAGADADQAHLRIAASLWGIKKLLKTFEVGGCPHAVATALLAGDAFRRAPGFPKLQPGDLAREFFILAEGQKWKGAAKAMRQTGKTFQYTALYEGMAAAIASVLWGMESPMGDLPLLLGPEAISLRGVQAFRRAWLKGMPEFETGWANTIATAESNRQRESRATATPIELQPAWLTDPVAGQRMDFYGTLTERDDAVENERNVAINFRVLAAEQAIMQAALARLTSDGCDFDEWGPGTGPLIQIHDSLTSLAPEGLQGASGAVYDMAPGNASDRVLVPARSARENTGRWLAELHGAAITTRLLTLPGVVHSGSGVWGDTLADA